LWKRFPLSAPLRETAGGQKSTGRDEIQTPFLFAQALLGFAKIYSEADGLQKQWTILSKTIYNLQNL
jgi:hypothetical protein